MMTEKKPWFHNLSEPVFEPSEQHQVLVPVGNNLVLGDDKPVMGKFTDYSIYNLQAASIPIVDANVDTAESLDSFDEMLNQVNKINLNKQKNEDKN